MKKKILALLCAVIACVGILFAFTACDDVSNGGTGGNTGNSGNSTLKMEKKYIGSYESSSMYSSTTCERYLIFHGNGTGEYYYYSKYKYVSSVSDEYNTDSLYEYTVHFKYTFVDSEKEAVVCFYDSVEYGERNKDGNVNTDWDWLLTVSGNVLCSTGSSGYTFFICEDYLPQIPNYKP